MRIRGEAVQGDYCLYGYTLGPASPIEKTIVTSGCNLFIQWRVQLDFSPIQILIF